MPLTKFKTGVQFNQLDNPLPFARQNVRQWDGKREARSKKGQNQALRFDHEWIFYEGNLSKEN